MRDSKKYPVRKIIRDFAELRYKHYKNKFWVKDREKIIKTLEKTFSKMVIQAARNGRLFTFYRHDKLKAICLIPPSHRKFFGILTREIVISYDNKDSKALAWLKETMKRKQILFSKMDIVTIPWTDKALLRFITRMGFHIDSINLRGNTKKALRLLRKRRPQRRLPNLTVRPIKTVGEVDEAIELHRVEFRRNPQFGWFVGLPKPLEFFRRMMLKELRKGRKNNFVIIDKSGRVVGTFGFTVDTSPFFGRTGGIGIVFNQSLQGKGYSKTAYLLMLEQLNKLGVKTINGNTAQPPVMKLSKDIGREPIIYRCQFGKGYFKPAHFSLSAS